MPITLPNLQNPAQTTGHTTPVTSTKSFSYSFKFTGIPNLGPSPGPLNKGKLHSTTHYKLVIKNRAKIVMVMAAKAPVVVLLVLMVLINGLQAAEICNMTEDGLMACKPSVTTEKPVDPTPECCKAVSGADMKCLCSYKGSMILPSLGIDPGLALSLPIHLDHLILHLFFDFHGRLFDLLNFLVCLNIAGQSE
ncbi:hypothetical protein LXL04_036718 [Taraxacum kok-saghyz]